jgi:ribosomal protein L37E
MEDKNIKECRKCKKVFYSNNYRKIYCSIKCFIKAKKARKYNKTVEEWEKIKNKYAEII